MDEGAIEHLVSGCGESVLLKAQHHCFQKPVVKGAYMTSNQSGAKDNRLLF